MNTEITDRKENVRDRITGKKANVRSKLTDWKGAESPRLLRRAQAVKGSS